LPNLLAIHYAPLIADVASSFILALVETLVAKTRAWEENRGLSFMYDGVPLLAMLDEYVMLRQEREEEKKRMRVSVTCSLNLESHCFLNAECSFIAHLILLFF
jgi:hypothetical protein